MILAKHGIDRFTKTSQAVSIGHPDQTDGPPTLVELRVLQMHAGEFNWLATRTRPDLAYYTSVLASVCTKHVRWCMELCKKVLRYLAGTIETGVTMPSEGSESQIQTWSDAGYGGVGTRSQTGLVISWGESIVTWRSARQGTAALSTCEAEVVAAATAYQVTEGLRYLLQEWKIPLGPTTLYVDNRSAIQIAENGGTWRTRYFAVRAARLQQEHGAGNVDIQYCQTDRMVADGLTKMSNASVLSRLREATAGAPPPMEGLPKAHKEDSSWWARMVLTVTPKRVARANKVWNIVRGVAQCANCELSDHWWEQAPVIYRLLQQGLPVRSPATRTKQLGVPDGTPAGGSACE